MYIDQEMTAREIANILGVKSTTTVCNWLRSHGISIRSRRAAQKPVTPSRETLENLYTEQELSMDAIGKKTGSSESSISALLNQYGIPKRHKWEKAAGWNKGIPLPEWQRNLLSHMAKKRTGKKSPRYRCILTKETKEKISNSLKGRYRGPDNPQWKNDNNRERHSVWHTRFEYKEWRQAVFIRDSYTCQMCKLPSIGNIEAHHIHPWSMFPEERFDVLNGITLCENCHSSIRHKEMEFAEEFLEITRRQPTQ